MNHDLLRLVELATVPAQGTFIALKPNWVCARDVYLWGVHNHVINPNTTKPDDLHCTLIYSEDELEGFEPAGRSMIPIHVSPKDTRWALFGPQHDVLVLRLFSHRIDARHYALQSMGFQPKYNPYLPMGAYPAHMTFNYKWHGTLASLPDFRDYGKDLLFDDEYMNPLKSKEQADGVLPQTDNITEEEDDVKLRPTSDSVPLSSPKTATPIGGQWRDGTSGS